jgi:hypothetical protein
MYKYKLKEIEIGDTEIRGGKKSTVSAIDDATGRIEWDIVDAADFSSVYKALLKAKDFLSTLEKEGKAKDDVVIDGFAEDIAKLFNEFRTHVRKEYPKEYERVSRLKESVNEGHGLETDDLEQLKTYTNNLPEDTLSDKAIKRILNFLIKSNIKVDKTKDLSKGKEVEEGEGIGYLTPNAFGKKKKNIYTSQYGYKLVPKKIKGSGLEVKQLFEYNDFQDGRIRNFDAIEDKINSILPMISNAKNKTAEFYNENPGSYNVNYPTDAILKELDDIIDQLKQANEDLSKSV